MKLQGKKALITGGNSGIGLATAELFVREGAQVAITGRDQATLDEAVALLGPSARAYRADVTDAHVRTNLFEELSRDFGTLDVVFANAGISGLTPTGTTEEAAFQNIIQINLVGAFLTVNSAAPMLSDGASVLFNGSVHNYVGYPGYAAYAATKGGVLSMARAIAAELAPRGIRVNVIAPGATKTPLWNRGRYTKQSPEESGAAAARVASLIPLARWGEASDIANAALFLASDAAVDACHAPVLRPRIRTGIHKPSTPPTRSLGVHRVDRLRSV